MLCFFGVLADIILLCLLLVDREEEMAVSDSSVRNGTKSQTRTLVIGRMNVSKQHVVHRTYY